MFRRVSASSASRAMLILSTRTASCAYIVPFTTISHFHSPSCQLSFSSPIYSNKSYVPLTMTNSGNDLISLSSSSVVNRNVTLASTMLACTRRYIAYKDIHDPAIADVAKQILLSGKPMALGKIITSITSKSKDRIFKSGKGVEGYLMHGDGAKALNIVMSDGVKMVTTSLEIETLPKEENSAGVITSKIGNQSRIHDYVGSIMQVANEKCCLHYHPAHEIYQLCRLPHISYDEFFAYIKESNKFWIGGNKCVRIKHPGENIQPPLIDTHTRKVPTSISNSTNNISQAPSPPTKFSSSFSSVEHSVSSEVSSYTDETSSSHPTVVPNPNALSAIFRKTTPNNSNSWGGWGSQYGVPNEEDVYEILKYVPIQWGNLGALNIPPAIKKKHIRVASVLQWLRRQPKFFEVRNIAGTLEVRRSILLHPEHHGKTPQEAEIWMRDRILSGEHNSVTSTTEMGGTTSLAAAAVYKFLVRVTPGYFVATELLFMRYSKKGLSPDDLVNTAKEHSNTFEVIDIKSSSKRAMKLIRRRTGADSTKWGDEFKRDVESNPDDVPALMALMGRCTCLWDRPQYLYVRLLESEKILVGGFDGMVNIMNRHPLVFKMGVNFFKRMNLSDPSSLEDSEPTGLEESPKQEDENVYLGHRDLAVVFHYVAPDEGNVNIAQLIECCSPAMKCVLPPRVMTVLQMFPDLFTCKEVSPGIYSIRKVQQKHAKSIMTSYSNQHQQHDVNTGQNTNNSGSFSNENDNGFDEDLTRLEVVQAFKNLIPVQGVTLKDLDSWLSLEVRNGIEKHYQTCENLIQNNSSIFRMERSGLIKVQ
eukprot:Tbor_TRINITY_DN1822_c0_g1::TRINITY_DN1822_c0_g1_i1::g.23034::m.23034